MARVKAGIPTVSELVEGETEYRQVSGQGVISYTKNDNQLYSTRTYPTPIPPVIDKKESSSISNIVNISTTGELELDFSSLSSATLANGDFLMFLDTTSSYAVRKEAIADVATLFAGTGLDASSSVLNVNLTDAAEAAIANGDYITFFDGGATGTLKKEAIADVATLFAGDGLQASSSVMALDLKSNGGIVIESNEAAVDLGASSITGTLAVGDGGTGATTLNNLITLGAHTEGSYVATLTAGTLIDLQNNSGENASPTVDVDLNEAAAAVMAAGDGIIFVDADDSNAAKQETLQDLLDTVAGTVATTGLDRSGATLVITDLHPVGVSGANDQLLTDDGDGTVTSESGLTYGSSVLAITGDLTISGGDITYGNGQNATNTITATAHDAAGKNLTISAGNTTAGTTNNIAGGALTFQGGQGKGSGAGGDIIFQTANAGSSGSTLNSLSTALTISDDGNVGINVSDPDVKLEVLSTSTQQKWSYDANSYATLLVSGSSAATFTTAESGDLHLDISGDIILSADGGNVTFLDGSSLALNIDMDDTAGDVVFKDAGNAEIFRIDGSENSVRFNSYSLNNSDPYPVSIKPLNSTQHMTMGLADKQNNYSMIGIYSAAAASISGVTADTSFDNW